MDNIVRRAATDGRLPSGRQPHVVVIGGGPAGLTAAYELSKQQVPATILEAESVLGGISQTVNYKGYLFDIGGHRFYTKVELVNRIWREVLGDEFLRRPRLSRIFFRGKYFRYPLEPWDTLGKLGPVESARFMMSWGRAVMFPTLPERDLQTWVVNRFGQRLFELFFKSYTEKVWGIPCDQIGSEWAAQRIRGLSFKSLVSNALGLQRKSGKNGQIKTLIEEFDYPRHGPGTMWNRMAEMVEELGGTILMQSPVDRIEWEPGRVKAVHSAGVRHEADQFISSIPIRNLILALDPPAPPELARVADHFQYRDFLTVALIIRKRDMFPDNWLYIHEPGVKVGRIQNFKNWSPDMVPDDETTCLGLEYFCFEGDNLWTMSDAGLIELGKQELVQMGLAEAGSFIDGAVVRMPKAYPVYNDTYKEALSAVRDFLRTVPNLQLVGRNGMHQYNNQDHSMLTAVLAARNVMGEQYDLWKANVDGDYLEEGREIGEADLAALRTGQPAVPAKLRAPA